MLRGREALAAQIPEMDGFEATAAIREKEKSTGAHIPIIAMTANALKGDEERCLAGGMDGHISKAIRTNELFAAMESFLDGAAAQPDRVEAQEELTQ